MLRFPFDEKKALEALVLVAEAWPNITPFFASKVFFLAEKEHLNRYGRPIIGDRYIAMENGPVPSVIYDWFKGNIDLMGDPAAITEAVNFDRSGRVTTAAARRAPDRSYLSPSDIATLQRAIEFCRSRNFPALSAATHRDQAWQTAELNTEMDPRLMIEGDNRDKAVKEAEEFAAYGVV